MTTAEYFKAEEEEIRSRAGRYIPPYRMANMMKTAQKVTDLLIRSDLCMSYGEIGMVLNIVQSAVDNATGHGQD